MEGYLPAAQCAAWGAASAPFLVQGVRKARALLAEKRSAALLLGAAGGYCFVMSALKLPSVAGSSSHPTGIGLGAILFGPWVMVLVGTIVLLFQALLLGHGGISTLGANAFSMAIAGAVVGWSVFRLARRLGVPLWLSALLGAALSDLTTYVMTSLQLSLAFPDEVSGVAGSLAKFLGIFAVTQVPLAVGEGILTALIMLYLVKHSRRELGEIGLLAPGTEA
jgi:cobalt/nickel transport system permease protein